MQQPCTNCRTNFDITDEDLIFLEKLSPSMNGTAFRIPPPTHCPDCRQQRRLSWRNERRLYHRTCDLTGEKIISAYSPEKPHKIYSPEAWNSDKWDAMSYGREFDFSRPFFEQFRELQEAVPRISLNVVNNDNSPYVNNSGYNKNCHLIFAAEYDQDCLYGIQVIKSNTCVDTLNCFESEGCYELTDSEKSYNLFFSRDCSNCSDSYFLYDCKGCTDCLFSMNLRKKQYCIFNEQLTQLEFEKRKQDFLKRLQTEGMASLQKEFDSFVLTQPHRAQIILNCENVEGNYLQHSRNLRHCFDLSYAEDCTYVYTGFQVKDMMDVCHTTDGEFSYECLSVGYKAYGTYFTHGSWSSNNVLYCDIVQSSGDCFGCVSLRQKHFCILNKQYSKEEYEEIVPRIIEHMKQTGEWGEFFPIELSPYAYNESLAQEYYPMSKREIEENGWRWREEEEMPKVEKVILASELPSFIDDIPDDILNWAIRCEVSGRPFRIIRQELDFYRNKQLPIPHLHFEERHKARMSLRNPRKLWKRTCSDCGKDIRTTYSPERPETIFCEDCYLKETY